MRFSMYSRLRFSMMIESMPCRMSSRASISPAGPAPMIPTWVRIDFSCLHCCNRIGAAGGTAVKAASCRWLRPASRSAARVRNSADRLAEFAFEIALFALDHADMQHEGERDGHHQHPVRGGEEARAQPRTACRPDIHGIAQEAENAARDQSRRGLPRLGMRSGAAESEHGGNGKREPGNDKDRADQAMLDMRQHDGQHIGRKQPIEQQSQHNGRKRQKRRRRDHAGCVGLAHSSSKETRNLMRKAFMAAIPGGNIKRFRLFFRARH